MGAFTFDHTAQQDDLYKAKTATQIKTDFDSRANEVKTALNNALTVLKGTTVGDSGAKNLGVSPISGVVGTNTQAILEDLKLQINGAVAGSIPDGSITQAKLAFTIATDAASTTIADAGLHFVSTNVEGALDELFTSANSVKTNVSGAIGLPATVNDTGSQLAGYITTEKGRIASEVGDGTSADTLKYLTDRLVVRSDAIATAVNAKGVASTSADTLAQLATKIGLIPVGTKSLSGTTSVSAGTLPFIAANGSSVSFKYITVTGLDFTPSSVIASTTSGDAYEFILHPQNLTGTAVTNARITNSGIFGGSPGSGTGFEAAAFQLTGNAYAIFGGFQIPVRMTFGSATTIKWTAKE